jgi:hypothetical protein
MNPQRKTFEKRKPKKFSETKEYIMNKYVRGGNGEVNKGAFNFKIVKFYLKSARQTLDSRPKTFKNVLGRVQMHQKHASTQKTGVKGNSMSKWPSSSGSNSPNKIHKETD